jgi:hypothetical protein
MKVMDLVLSSMSLLLLMLALSMPTAPDHSSPPPLAASAGPSVTFHQSLADGWQDRSVDVTNTHALFAHVFAHLPPEVRVHPTENYYYWQLAIDGRSLHGNFRLVAGRREHGEIAFACGEPTEFLEPNERAERLVHNKVFTADEGVVVEMTNPLTVKVSYHNKTVVFHLNPLPQTPPTSFALPPQEKFLQRIHDESGLRFHLLYDTTAHHFFWVLDEETPVPEHFRPLTADVVIGRRTGFVFWSQKSVGGRRILASVRRRCVLRNDYYDGPFDQLADNFVQGDGLRPWIEEAMPWYKGRVDRWGNLTDGPSPRRVALTAYGQHDEPDEAVALIKQALTLPDPIGHLARGGGPPSAGR